MQCPQCEIDVGAGESVFERTHSTGSEWVCSVNCCNKREPQGELWSTWRLAVCVEESVTLFGAKVKKAGFGGKALQKEMGVILPGDASIDQLNKLAMLEVKLVIVTSSIQPLPQKTKHPLDEPRTDDLLSSHGFDEIKELNGAKLFTLDDVRKLKSVVVLMERTGWPRSRARDVMGKVKALKK